MQCSSCQFENMPGVEACGRCGSPLGLRTLGIDVHPPRAGAWTKRMRRWLPWRVVYYRAQEVARRQWFEGLEGADLFGSPFGVLIRMIVPGWAHLHLGQRTRGLWFHLLWLVLVVLSLVCFLAALDELSFYRGGVTLGTLGRMRGALSWGGMFLGLAFSVHLASCLSLARQSGIETGEFWRRMGLGLIMVLAGLYLLVGWLLFSIAIPVS